ncbi:MAG: hypothetical protein R6V83_13405 [Candidatus Thorarchaeota archaeon]
MQRQHIESQTKESYKQGYKWGFQLLAPEDSGSWYISCVDGSLSTGGVYLVMVAFTDTTNL